MIFVFPSRKGSAHSVPLGLTQTNKKIDDDVILQVFEKGYRYRDRVIRHARVIVNKK